jgi:hypothetical protein
MVKPYHEKVTRSFNKWMSRPTQGWAEMTNQALFHAAGMGHMHQKVHVAEHNMGPGFENEPGLVVHMEPHMSEVADMEPEHWHPSVLHDTTKIALMDYLGNNLDRHGGNLLIRNPAKHDPAKHASRVMAIDHGRNFQYKSKTKYPQSELEMGAPPESLLEDSLSTYFANPGIARVSQHSSSDGGPRVSSPGHFTGMVQQWWPSVRQNVVATMHHQLKGLKDQGHRSHIWKNFMERVNKLDDIARFPEEYANGGRELLNTPIYTPQESVNAYNPWRAE